jgi:two-component SAPR family response regulator
MMTAPTAAVTARCLGRFSLTVGGAPVERWRAGKTRRLFQYLLVNRGRVVLREKLQQALWPGAEWSRSSGSLKVAMHALRQILAAPTTDSGGPTVRILHQDHGYALHADDIWIDLEQFEADFQTGRAAEARGDCATAVQMYRRAVELYDGDFLAGECADWIEEQREWMKAIALRALDRLRDDAVGRHDFSEAILCCRRILDIDPYREEAYQTLMSVHGYLGELGRVRSWHELCVRRLRTELDVEPTSATEHLFRRAIRGELRPRRPAGAPVELHVVEGSWHGRGPGAAADGPPLVPSVDSAEWARSTAGSARPTVATTTGRAS